jgi:hypothetical protein
VIIGGRAYNETFLGHIGGAGGDGGTGGPGGHGAGGTGGPSLGLVLLRGGSANVDAASSLMPGPGGAGGASPGNAGPMGISQAQFTP